MSSTFSNNIKLLIESNVYRSLTTVRNYKYSPQVVGVVHGYGGTFSSIHSFDLTRPVLVGDKSLACTSASVIGFSKEDGRIINMVCTKKSFYTIESFSITEDEIFLNSL